MSDKLIYSKRVDQEMKEKYSEKLEYETLSPKIRQQVIYLWKELWEENSIIAYKCKIRTESIVDTLRKEYGKEYLSLPPNTWWEYHRDPLYSKIDKLKYEWTKECELEYFIKHESTTIECLSVIELIFGYPYEIVDKNIPPSLINSNIGEYLKNEQIVRFKKLQNYRLQLFDNKIEELNRFFQESNLGYRFKNGFIARIDSEFTFQHIHEPAMGILQEVGFEKVNEELIRILKLSRDAKCEKEYEDVIALCRKFYETSMKHTIEKMNHKASTRIDSMVKKLVELKIIPEKMKEKFQKEFIDRNTLNQAAHGVGENDKNIEYNRIIMELMLNNVVSAVLFIIRSYKMQSKVGTLTFKLGIKRKN